MNSEIQKLTILHTNDIHSLFENMPKIATIFRDFEQKLPNEKLLKIDCGDHMDRMRVETEGSYGLANIEILNRTGYEAVTLGNNEGLTFEPSLLSELYKKHADFQVIGSNIYDLKSNKIPSWMKPYLIIKKGKLKVGIVGVTINFSLFYELLGLDVKEPLEVIRTLVEELRPQVDMIIIISHLGLPTDQRMAKEIKGIDCILGAHTHHLLEEPLFIGDAMICAAGKLGQYVGVAELEFDFENHRMLSANARCINVSSYSNDAEIEDTIRKYKEIGIKKLSEPIAELEQTLQISWNKESPLGNLLAQGLKNWTGAQIGIVNSGQILKPLYQGRITREILLEICPSPINPCRMWLKGKQIREACEQALLPEFQQKSIRGFGFRGEVLGILNFDGMKVEYLNGKVMDIWVENERLVEEQEYLVGTIDMFTFGIGYHSLKEGRDIKFYLPEFLRDVLLDQIQNPEEILRSSNLRWIERG
ncbi:bifunctional metallophosphatase/5'-nucleotidase [Chengkuizengella axinellae]|uniref:Bifunctional UDP-sugar hydrolase/5'-nucleotidase n=1 Tax=Chengkuizengella axinellae TaxID=3064388 RepID=A0ABT9J0D4_9BACL|nr:bifunctional UDP-sugar hydrolase/5'-nucleotidase [Chengkuizengella sp. 2205SS18-9]MDP5275080.1 bifunctional UDP-sugar hydrolase/5'-nucleotidase [Chengkuizengella sp. 2205SS18-9]